MPRFDPYCLTYAEFLILPDLRIRTGHESKLIFVPQILHFEPSLDALSVRSDVISSIKIVSPQET